MSFTAFRNTAVLDDAVRPLRKYLDQEDVTEVVINQPLEVAVERKGGWSWAVEEELTLSRLNILATAAAAFTSQDITRENPICSTIFPTGERVQIVAPPVAPDGTVSITIRKPSTKAMSMEDFHDHGLFSETRVAERGMTDTEHQLLALLTQGRHVEFFTAAVRARLNILISGATGSGKTTFAKGLIRLIPDEERLLTIEDTRELVVPHRNVVHMTYSKDGQGTAKVTAKELLESALRMRPDRILLQELRDGTAFFYLRNVNSGHPGSITTIHAASAELAFDQLTLLVKESEGGADLGRDDIRSLLKILVDVVVQMKKVKGQFRVTEIYYDPAGRHAE
ncbi:P-type DNA transfer ATPase VirB11 [Novosphingobium sp. Chol11]|uniref:P-type DNA transfer ATPase VirB11 n=1 Tax=Novosphingobium sp. Chol11 TaxID=1385763 RepID=UPI000BE451A4|nr:P-type DNA transfer ATPase VirB11 [Novosphingobium sp. Chol11]